MIVEEDRSEEEEMWGWERKTRYLLEYLFWNIIFLNEFWIV